MASVKFLVRTDWPQLQGNAAHDGTNPYENELSPSTVSTLQPGWSVAEGSMRALTIAGGRVFVRDNLALHVLDAATGREDWTRPGLVTDVAVTGHLAFVSSGTTLDALDTATGGVVWSATVGAGLSAPTAEGSTVFVGADRLLAFNASGCGAPTCQPTWAGTTIGSVGTPAAGQGSVYVAGFDGHLYDFASTCAQASCNPKWTKAIAPTQQYPTPVIGSGIVYVNSQSLYAFNADSGALMWSATGGPPESLPAVAQTLLYFDAGNVSCYVASTGVVRWTRALPSYVSPAVANDVLYVIGGGQVLALQAASGKRLWASGVVQGIWGTPAVADGVVYASDDNGKTVAFGRAPAIGG